MNSEIEIVCIWSEIRGAFGDAVKGGIFSLNTVDRRGYLRYSFRIAPAFYACGIILL